MLKRARTIEATSQRSHSTVTDAGQFSILTEDDEGASESSVARSDRGHSDTSDDEGIGPSNVMDMDSSEYSPVSDVEQEPRKVKTEDLRVAQAVQVLTQHQQAT